MTPEDVLTGAIETIERDGWHQGTYCDYNGPSGPAFEEADAKAPVCAMGAMQRVVTGYATRMPEYGTDEREAHDAAVTRLARALGWAPDATEIDPYAFVVKYNDAEGATQEDILLAMKKAIGHDQS